MHQAIGLFPELDLGQFAMIPTVTDDAVRTGQSARQISGLRGTSDRRKNWNYLRAGSALAEPVDARRVRPNNRIREPDHVDDRGASHLASTSPQSANNFLATLRMPVLQLVNGFDDFGQIHFMRFKTLANGFQQCNRQLATQMLAELLESA